MSRRGKSSHEKRLRRGRTIRSRRASLLRDVRTHRIDVGGVLSDVPDALLTCPVHTLLINTPKIGAKRAQKTCETLELWPLKPLGEMSDEDRAAVYDTILAWQDD